jgi:cation diffusion facilitator family transporter
MKFTKKSKAAAISIASNTSLILLKLVAGFITGSVSLLAEAIHSVMDLAAAVVAFISVRIADKPSDEQHHFGHGKAENISGVVEGLLIFVAAGIIIKEAIDRLIEGATLELVEVGIGIMVVSIIVNIVVSRYLLRVSKTTESLALEADARHLTTDVTTMFGVLVALIIVRLTGFNLLDPIIAIIVALIIIKAAYDITKKSFGGLMDASLPEEEENAIRACIAEHKGQIIGHHKLRTRKSGSQRYIDLHLVLPQNIKVSEAHDFCDHLEKDLENILRQVNVTIHIEPCSSECQECSVSCDDTAKKA